MRISTFLLALFTLTAFAANSILCRLALISGSNGPVEFTLIRLGSGIAILLPLIMFRQRLFGASPSGDGKDAGLLKMRLSNLWPALALFGYAVFFSLAYVQLDAGVGALILFPTVQISMMGGSLLHGHRVRPFEWLGMLVSLSGLVYLLMPGLSAPPLLGTVLMIASGMSWGAYSLLGRHQTRPILSTARNFLFCLPGVVILGLVMVGNVVRGMNIQMTADGILLAVISGAIASAAGYVLWYLTLARLTTTVASVSQLLVPILAAMGGVLFLNEALSMRLVVASVPIMGGIVITILSRKKPERSGV